MPCGQNQSVAPPVLLTNSTVNNPAGSSPVTVSQDPNTGAFSFSYPATTRLYHVVCFYSGKPAAANTSTGVGQLLQWTCSADLPSGVTFAINFGGNARGFLQAAPTATATLNLYKIPTGSAPGTLGTLIGTISIATSGAFTFTLSAATAFAAGDTLTCWAPTTQDATLAGIGFLLPGAA